MCCTADDISSERKVNIYWLYKVVIGALTHPHCMMMLLCSGVLMGMCFLQLPLALRRLQAADQTLKPLEAQQQHLEQVRQVM